eukprot:CAMPEP_0182898326 /NCGR_PEP_ID=MMETSP0034_2-20130328/27418_1 /TAXON_ID=156128 /ORGANISM="Nephroselmis pyriformis, Strain CCMP717" /LENGTH=60 /DNA_ID=CAMNT_0025032289 /DNA_START=62 /DNA_END=240 /DNA_ORIENTATION=-
MSILEKIGGTVLSDWSMITSLRSSPPSSSTLTGLVLSCWDIEPPLGGRDMYWKSAMPVKR